MGRLVDAFTAAEKVRERHGIPLGDLVDTFAEIPSADAEPVRHGHWVNPHWRNANYCCDCSECHAEAMHEKFRWHKSGIYHICPNCGAKMDEEEIEDDRERTVS